MSFYHYSQLSGPNNYIGLMEIILDLKEASSNKKGKEKQDKGDLKEEFWDQVAGISAAMMYSLGFPLPDEIENW